MCHRVERTCTVWNTYQLYSLSYNACQFERLLCPSTLGNNGIQSWLVVGCPKVQHLASEVMFSLCVWVTLQCWGRWDVGRQILWGEQSCRSHSLGLLTVSGTALSPWRVSLLCPCTAGDAEAQLQLCPSLLFCSDLYPRRKSLLILAQHLASCSLTKARQCLCLNHFYQRLQWGFSSARWLKPIPHRSKRVALSQKVFLC